MMFEIEQQLYVYLPRLALAVILSGIIGWERETEGKAAGFRTHLLFGMGTCLFTLLGIEIAQTAVDPSEEVARIFAGLVQGIGFLGAGVILREAGEVRGLTTAAGIWAVAAMSVSVAVGAYLLAVITAALILIALRLLKKPEIALEKNRRHRVARRRDTDFE
jgi:putative Mg2+ transporter-C (MgtC) family protein